MGDLGPHLGACLVTMLNDRMTSTCHLIAMGDNLKTTTSAQTFDPRRLVAVVRCVVWLSVRDSSRLITVYCCCFGILHVLIHLRSNSAMRASSPLFIMETVGTRSILLLQLLCEATGSHRKWMCPLFCFVCCFACLTFQHCFSQHVVDVRRGWHFIPCNVCWRPPQFPQLPCKCNSLHQHSWAHGFVRNFPIRCRAQRASKLMSHTC